MLGLRHKGGAKAGRGNYWNFSTGERVILESEGTLPGNSNVTYYKASPFVILAAGPFLGLLYAAFLPFIGIAIVAHTVINKIFTVGVDELAKVAAFNWSPAAAYLAGRHHETRNSRSRKIKDSPGPREKKA